MIARLLSGLAATALVAAPVAASAAPTQSAASKLSVSKSVRSGTASKDANGIAGASLLPALLGAAILAGGIYLVVDSNDDDADSN